MRIFCKKCGTEFPPIWNPKFPFKSNPFGKIFIDIIAKEARCTKCGGRFYIDWKGKEKDYQEGNERFYRIRKGLEELKKSS